MAIENLTDSENRKIVPDILKRYEGYALAFAIIRTFGEKGAQDHIYIGTENETPTDLVSVLLKDNKTAKSLGSGRLIPKQDIQIGEGMHLYVTKEGSPFDRVEAYLRRIGTPHPRD